MTGVVSTAFSFLMLPRVYDLLPDTIRQMKDFDTSIHLNHLYAVSEVADRICGFWKIFLEENDVIILRMSLSPEP